MEQPTAINAVRYHKYLHSE